MALIKFGAGVVQMSGSIAGDVHARNRFGNYTRPRTKPVNPKSSRQVAARIAIMYLAEQWRESPMTGAIRTAWETYANSVNWNNRLGEQVTLTGFNMFVRGNSAMLAAGGALVTAGPTDLGLPAGDPTFAVTISAATQKLSVTFDDGFDWLDEDDGFLSVYMGQPQSASRTFFGGPFRLAGSIAGDSVTPPTSPDATLDVPYTAIEGQQTWCEGRIIRCDARCSTKFSSGPVIIDA
jgi:hypothetical protein